MRRAKWWRSSERSPIRRGRANGRFVAARAAGWRFWARRRGKRISVERAEELVAS
jgi:hypothetical protein